MTDHVLFNIDTSYPTLTLDEPKEHKVIFKVDDKEPLILTKEGFYYNEQFIEDAGLAYKLFLERVK